MGLWGAAQAIAFAVGGLLGTGAVDLARAVLGSNVAAYAIVFGAEAILFLVAARMAAQVVAPRPAVPAPRAAPALAGAWARQ
jgi:BCD family chlorophyll transporter-like MFS transporter